MTAAPTRCRGTEASAADVTTPGRQRPLVGGSTIALLVCAGLLLTNLVAVARPSWYASSIDAAIIVIAGLLIAGVAALLDRGLAVERNLRFEKACSEQRLQAALDEASRLSAVLETTPDIVGIASLDGRGLYLNRAGRQRLGLKPEQSPGDYHISAFYTEQSFQTVAREGIPSAMANGNWSSELVMRSLDGEEIPVSMAGLVHFDADGAPQYMSAIARDISGARRTAVELQRAKDAAEAANRSKSTFLATMSHEIRTPMNAVIGMTDLLLSTELTVRQREFVETIRAGGDALLAVINDILDFSKIEAGRIELEHRPFDLRLALESSVDLLAPRAAEKGLELALSIDPAVPDVVVGDELRIRQILVNLVGNGIKFTERGEVVVSVTAGSPGSHGARVELLVTVRDTGIGIPPARRDQLFTSFAQLDPSTTREFGGTGLGLAISKRLVELMDGSIRAESDGVPGRGSVFQFSILVDRTPGQHRPSSPGSQPALAGRRVLVVDDNATSRHILGQQLHAWGMRAVEAAAPSEALELLRRRDSVDLVILDMQMPGLDGLALARAICDHRGGRRLPIIMLTSIGSELGPDAEGIPCFAARLTKPVKASQLYDAIITAVAGRAMEGEGRPAGTVVGGGRSPSAPLAILLAEDMDVNRRFALLALEQLGYGAASVATGAEVLRELDRASYDVILMDVQMPELDGLEATRRIRRGLPAERQPYIIAMTANAMRGDRELCLEAGMDDYLSKPIYLDQLRVLLERAAARIAASRESAARVERTPVGPGAPPDEDRDVPVVDRRRVDSGGLPLIDLFTREADDTLRRLREAVDRADTNGVREAAHALKGISGYVGAARVVAASARIERTARAGQPVDAATVETLAAELTALRQALLTISPAPAVTPDRLPHPTR